MNGPMGTVCSALQARSQVRKRGGSKKIKSGPKVGVVHQKGEGVGGGSAPSRASRGSF